MRKNDSPASWQGNFNAIEPRFLIFGFLQFFLFENPKHTTCPTRCINTDIIPCLFKKKYHCWRAYTLRFMSAHGAIIRCAALPRLTKPSAQKRCIPISAIRHLKWPIIKKQPYPFIAGSNTGSKEAGRKKGFSGLSLQSRWLKNTDSGILIRVSEWFVHFLLSVKMSSGSNPLSSLEFSNGHKGGPFI